MNIIRTWEQIYGDSDERITFPLLDLKYICKINNRVKEPTLEYPNWNTNQTLIFYEYVEVKESLYSRVLICVNTIPSHVMLWRIYEFVKILKWYIDQNGAWKHKYMGTYSYHMGRKP